MMKISYTISAVGLLLALLAVGAAAARPTPQTSTPTPAPTPTPLPAIERDVLHYPERGSAPELHNTIWLNTTTPLRLQDLRGSVVLLEFWTFDCINCQRVTPYVEGWHQTYREQGLTVIGNHFPEFYYEHDVANVLAALTTLEITYPVAIDNDGATWQAYNQRYWPTIHLIDKWGELRYVHFGEGRYKETEQAIQTLLAENYSADELSAAATEDATATPLDYLTTDITLNVRSGAGLSFGIIGALQPNMALVILSETDGWYKIAYNDGEGYVSGEYVTVASL
ncbi:MAG: SH3 domain-containing protein [Armatimonadetes bacterium]|nr:SH3 domain-containing protein [Anaerolineae bacterium]